jgi:hypothetical protein
VSYPSVLYSEYSSNIFAIYLTSTLPSQPHTHPRTIPTQKHNVGSFSHWYWDCKLVPCSLEQDSACFILALSVPSNSIPQIHTLTHTRHELEPTNHFISLSLPRNPLCWTQHETPPPPPPKNRHLELCMSLLVQII